MTPDIYINVRLKMPEEGGQKSHIFGEFYSCPMLIDGEGFDCRLMIKGLELLPGTWLEVPVKFLNRDLAISNLSIGKAVVLWEGKDIADGVVTRIIP
jgi:hypothetical protein